MNGYEFRGSIKGVSTGRQLGQDTAAAVTGRVTVEFNALGVNLNNLVRLQRAGELVVQLVPVEPTLPHLETGDGASDGE